MSLPSIDDGDVTRPPQEPRLGGDVEEVLAHLLAQAICQWLLGTTASRRRSSGTHAAWLGFARERERDRGRGKGARARGEELVGVLLIYGASTAWTGRRARGGGATLAVATGAGEDDREEISPSPLEFSLATRLGPFSFIFCFIN